MKPILAAAVASLLALVLGGARVRADDRPIRIYAAGSLAEVMPKLIAGSGLPPAAVAPPIYGPAGTLRQRLLDGAQADLFASADLAQPRTVAGSTGAPVVPFARNRMCVLAPKRLGLTTDNLLDHLLAPGLRLATSTPGADPGGDYAMAVFRRADALHPGAGAILRGKAIQPFAGPGAITALPGHGRVATIFLGRHADALLGYCSGASGPVREVPDLVAVPVPAALEVHPVYGLLVLSFRPDVERLALFIVSERGQAILAANGLLPLVQP